MKKFKAIVLGAGYRGRAYAEYAAINPDKLEIVGVADPVQAETIPAPKYWNDWRDCLNDRPDADIVIISTPDDLHYEPAMAALDAGYHLLLEKPISPTEAESREIIAKALRKKKLVFIGHVLRYSPSFARIKALIDSGEMGEVVSISHQESAGYFKVAHSYVRGIFNNSQKSSPVILAKCSHDFDLFAWWLAGKKCLKVTSFGSLSHFVPENRPQGAAERCSQCPNAIEKLCLWSAKKMYLESTDLHYLFADSTRPAMQKVVAESRFGRCVYCCDNDVPDHQAVLMEFEGGVTVSHMMTGFTNRNMRTTRISCTKGEIFFDGSELHVNIFSGDSAKADVPEELRGGNYSRHGGGDLNLVAAMLRVLESGDEKQICDINRASLQSHVISFAAERSRLAGGVTVHIDD
ncbi:MAG: Gfo/Idh/MocA family oxidoreductase [Kiritimatiellae bacterium]|nr:Gfo/Idh/MocA family oxidoreductase [Kiritimatiellia bacterium]